MAMLLIFSGLLMGCEDSSGEREVSPLSGEEHEPYFLVALSGGEMEGQVAEYVCAALAERGHSCRTVNYTGGEWASFEEDPPAVIIWVGRDAAGIAASAAGVPSVGCVPELYGAQEDVISPSIGAGSLARAALLLLPCAGSYSVISEAAGGADVQDACDYLDMSGVNYTVEVLGERSRGDAVFSAAQKGCEVLILPFRSVSAGGGIDLSAYGTALFVIGEGEPVRGALATFCVDAERLALAAADRAEGLYLGEERAVRNESYYVLCISRSIADGLATDTEAVMEDFRVVMVE